uniref:HDC04828 n=1 Tax=Drosophila melanogaster TaxID=7227 RepID=Q6IGW3_DROME|nr:TPA_inf: HDC04828 [Drosophila melanogaster]
MAKCRVDFVMARREAIRRNTHELQARKKGEKAENCLLRLEPPDPHGTLPSHLKPPVGRQRNLNSSNLLALLNLLAVRCPQSVVHSPQAAASATAPRQTDGQSDGVLKRSHKYRPKREGFLWRGARWSSSRQKLRMMHRIPRQSMSK